MIKKHMYVFFFLLCIPQIASASLIWSWQINDGQIYNINDEILIEATLFNDLSSTQNIVKDDIDSFAKYGGYSVDDHWQFDFGPGPDAFSLWPLFDDVNLAPGESFDFIVGRYIPKYPNVIVDGTYSGVLAMRLNYGIYHELDLIVDQDTVSVSAGVISNVPLPASAWLFLSGIAGITSVFRKRRLSIA